MEVAFKQEERYPGEAQVPKAADNFLPSSPDYPLQNGHNDFMLDAR